MLGALRSGTAGGGVTGAQASGTPRAPVAAASLSGPRSPLPVETDKSGSPCPPSPPASPPAPTPAWKPICHPLMAPRLRWGQSFRKLPPDARTSLLTAWRVRPLTDAPDTLLPGGSSPRFSMTLAVVYSSVPQFPPPPEGDEERFASSQDCWESPTEGLGFGTLQPTTNQLVTTGSELGNKGKSEWRLTGQENTPVRPEPRQPPSEVWGGCLSEAAVRRCIRHTSRPFSGNDGAKMQGLKDMKRGHRVV